MIDMKNFVLDTNVILHDAHSIYNFQENDVYLPIVVLEELDNFKKGNEQINFNARDFIRELDKISDKDLFKNGASLGSGLGRLYIVIGNQYDSDIVNAFPEKKPDHRILSTTKWISRQHPDTKCILVTKDVNLRMKARSLDIEAQDYYSDKVKNSDQFDKVNRVFEIEDPEIIDWIYKSPNGLTKKEIGIDEDIAPNEYFTIKGGEDSVIVRNNPFTNKIHKIEKSSNSGIKPRNAEQAFAFEALNDPEVKLVAITGVAGTGKTLLALAAALKQVKLYKSILLMRPIVSLSNKDLGFLPGTEKEKIAPYMQPLFDNLNVIKYQTGGNINNQIEDLQTTGKLAIEALAFIRGRSLAETYCIIDEAQNLTPHEIKTIITRAGEGTKMVFTGDIHQIDSPYLDSESNGLAYMIDKMKGQNIFAHINLVKGERSELAEIASNLL
ncbi:MAG: PhoH family protein [Bacteroidales bacterium]|nr:PhoH family protein [Bacteroidales bacterium]